MIVELKNLEEKIKVKKIELEKIKKENEKVLGSSANPKPKPMTCAGDNLRLWTQIEKELRDLYLEWANLNREIKLQKA